MRLPFPLTLAGLVVIAVVPVACGSNAAPANDVVPDGGRPSSSGSATVDGGEGPGDAMVASEASALDAPALGEAASAADAGAGAVADAGGDAPAASSGPYGSDGPSSVTTVSLSVPSPNGAFTTTAYVPSGTAPAPVVVLSSGFFQPAAAYAPYAHRLASWGIVTLTRDDPNLGEGTPTVVSDVQYTVSTWLDATSTDASSALHGRIDTTRVGLAGHSRGGQVALLAGEGLAGKIRGVFGLDPVDQSTGSDPEARTTLGTIGVPVAFIGETTDDAASGCAPAADDFLVLYQAASSPAVALTAAGADHTMFEDPASCSFCTLCTKGTADASVVLSTAVRYLTAFFARELLGDASVGAAFQGAGAAQDVAAGVVTIQSK